MKEYFLQVMKKSSKGLYICESPTGYGKSYYAAQAISAYQKDSSKTKKIIFITSLNKNLAIKELQVAFGKENIYNKNVLHIRSVFDEIIEKIFVTPVHTEFINEHYDLLKTKVEIYKKASANQAHDNDYLALLEKKVREAERQFRFFIEKKLMKDFPTKEERLHAIKTEKKYHWIGILYPSVYTDDFPILIMSVKKFLMKNTPIIEPSYDFLEASFIEDSIIFIDEFDESKQTITNHLIESALNIHEDYIELFVQLYKSLQTSALPNSILTASKQVGKKDYISLFMDDLEQTYKKYELHLHYKTHKDSIDTQQNFLFNDASFQNIIKVGKHYIRTSKNEKANQVEIVFETAKDYHENKQRSDINIFAMLREITSVIKRFSAFSLHWAEEYARTQNNIKDTFDEISKENALETILRSLHLSKGQRALVKASLPKKTKNRTDTVAFAEVSYYKKGFKIFEFEDNPSHNEQTNIKAIEYRTAAEKILISLAQRATVFGLSATAEMPSIASNYNIRHLREALGNDLHTLPQELKNTIRIELEKIWKPYDDGKIQITTKVFPSSLNSFDCEQECKSIFTDRDAAKIASKLILNVAEDDYYRLRYCNIVRAMYSFIHTESLSSMLYVGMALAKDSNPNMHPDTLKKLFQLVAKKNKQHKNPSIAFLSSSNFDAAKEAILEKWKHGEKLFVMSSYKTIGAGQNFQYPIDTKEGFIELTPYKGDGDQRHFKKDFDALYLGEITNLVTNTRSSRKFNIEETMRMCILAEELYEHDEINRKELKELIKIAFKRQSKQYSFMTSKIYSRKSIKLYETAIVMQAIGRMCRTFVKNKHIHIYIDSKVLENIDTNELKKHILPPEMKALIALKNQPMQNESEHELEKLNAAARISSFANWEIMQYLRTAWTDKTMEEWEHMRLIVLRYPTASIKLFNKHALIKKYYVSSGIKQNSYLFSTKDDFDDVIIDFSNDTAAFTQSKRAKLLAGTENFIIHTMSEANSGLQTILKYSGMQDFFEKNRYATSFKKEEYMMCPVLYNNIYKGALGEVAGSFILKKELGIVLKPIVEPEYYEVFDYEMAPGVYVDFKHWKYTYKQDRRTTEEEISYKLNKIGAKRVYIINIVGDPSFETAVPKDKRIIQIPCLLDTNGNTIKKMMKKIEEEDINGSYK